MLFHAIFITPFLFKEMVAGHSKNHTYPGNSMSNALSNVSSFWSSSSALHSLPNTTNSTTSLNANFTSQAVNFTSALLLLDVLVRKFTGKKPTGSSVEANPETPSQLACNAALLIMNQFGKLLLKSHLHKKASTTPVNTFELYQTVHSLIVKGKCDQVPQVLQASLRQLAPNEEFEQDSETQLTVVNICRAAGMKINYKSEINSNSTYTNLV